MPADDVVSISRQSWSEFKHRSLASQRAQGTLLVQVASPPPPPLPPPSPVYTSFAEAPPTPYAVKDATATGHRCLRRIDSLNLGNFRPDVNGSEVAWRDGLRTRF